MYSIGIIGCGSIGSKRAYSLGAKGRLVACADLDFKKSQKLAEAFKAEAFEEWRELLKLKELDIVIVSTLHDSLVEITLAAIQAGKHVLVEKPAARSVEELAKVKEAVRGSDLRIRVGFNHRYHRALLKAKKIVESGELGELMFVRGRYGHGGRVGYDKEWRSDAKLSGGGELIDQGPHLIDLSRWFLGEFVSVEGFVNTYYWNMKVEDNGFMLLKTIEDKVAFLHVSCTEWKNLFSLEIYGKSGKLDVSGLGGSYGIEKLTHYNLLSEMGPPETQAWEFPMADNSWEMEMNDFYDDIKFKRKPSAGIDDAYEALKIIENLYSGSKFDYRP